jgi:PleD family two-component response regulator
MTQTRILVVEDDPDLVELLNIYFGMMNYEVVSASWGAEAVQIARDEVINLVVLDIRLPDIDGYEVCRQLRAQRRSQDIPIIFLTEKRDRVDKLQGLELGVVDYITKPFDNEELRLRVRNVLKRAQNTSMIHRVTELPEGALVDERLEQALHSKTDTALIGFALTGLDGFQERYGFVAADDVLRALVLMLRNAVRELGSEEDYMGHLAPHDIFVLTSAANAEAIRDRVQTKMMLSREFFYPLQDREDDAGDLKLAEDELIALDAVILPLTGGAYAHAQALRGAVDAEFAAL